MLEFIVIALIGSLIAGIWDLKTTEVPDEIPALMIVFGIFLWFINAGTTGNFTGFVLSLVIGTSLLLIGLLLYYKGQWGGADAWVLAAIGYLVPIYNGNIFIFDYISNFIVVSAIYMVIYALILGVLNPKLFGYFPREFKAKAKYVALIIAVFAIPLGYIMTLGASPVPLLLSFGMIVLLTIFWVYAKVIEKYAFKKEIPVSKLRPGDVLEEMLWVGITPEQITEISKKRKTVTIKEGVRFVPAFFLTLVVTLLFGNILIMLF